MQHSYNHETNMENPVEARLRKQEERYRQQVQTYHLACVPQHVCGTGKEQDGEVHKHYT